MSGSKRAAHGCSARGGEVVVEVVGEPRPLDLLADLRRSGITRIDRLVVGAGDDATVRLLAHRWPIGAVEQRAPPRPTRPG